MRCGIVMGGLVVMRCRVTARCMRLYVFVVVHGAPCGYGVMFVLLCSDFIRRNVATFFYLFYVHSQHASSNTLRQTRFVKHASSNTSTRPLFDTLLAHTTVPLLHHPNAHHTPTSPFQKGTVLTQSKQGFNSRLRFFNIHIHADAFPFVIFPHKTHFKFYLRRLGRVEPIHIQKMIFIK
jgi:hypothetical protein